MDNTIVVEDEKIDRMIAIMTLQEKGLKVNDERIKLMIKKLREFDDEEARLHCD